MDKNVKSGKEIVDDFFNNIQNVKDVDKDIAKSLEDLYNQGKFTDTNVKNLLQNLREKDVYKN